MKTIAIAGLNKEKFNFLKRKYKSVNIIKLTDSNFFKNININAFLVFWRVGSKKKSFHFFK